MLLRRVVITYSVWLVAAYGLYAAEPDRAVLSVMRSATTDVYYVQILKRVPVDAELDLVIALGTPKDWGLSKGDSGE